MDISSLAPRVLAQLRGCSEDFAIMELRAVARDFCRESDIWREALDTIATVADQADYNLEDEHEYAAHIQRVRLVTLDDSDLSAEDWSLSVDGVLTLDPAPAETDMDLDVDVVFVPDLDADDHPDFLVSRWAEALIVGAVARLKLQAGSGQQVRPWFDPSGGQLATAQYQGLIAEARRECFLERKSGDLAMNVPPLI
jgi:hypothetical protein